MTRLWIGAGIAAVVLLAAGLWMLTDPAPEPQPVVRTPPPPPRPPAPPPALAALPEPPDAEVDLDADAMILQLREETDPSGAAERAEALARFAATLPPADPQRMRILSAILERAARPGETELRLRTHHPFAELRLAPAELEPLIDVAASDDVEARLWSLRVLERRWEADPPTRAVALAVCRVCARDPRDKVREYAARTLEGAPANLAGPLLDELSRDAAWHVRAAAARAMPRNARLEEMAQTDPDERVRRAAIGRLTTAP
jgi:hypothetical protein